MSRRAWAPGTSSLESVSNHCLTLWPVEIALAASLVIEAHGRRVIWRDGRPRGQPRMGRNAGAREGEMRILHVPAELGGARSSSGHACATIGVGEHEWYVEAVERARATVEHRRLPDAP